jgi:hypothetical protein
MNAVEIQTHAQKLYEAMGPKALAEAAEKARRFEQTGDEKQARDWKLIGNALQQLRGPNVS